MENEENGKVRTWNDLLQRLNVHNFELGVYGTQREAAILHMIEGESPVRAWSMNAMMAKAVVRVGPRRPAVMVCIGTYDPQGGWQFRNTRSLSELSWDHASEEQRSRLWIARPVGSNGIADFVRCIRQDVTRPLCCGGIPDETLRGDLSDLLQTQLARRQEKLLGEIKAYSSYFQINRTSKRPLREVIMAAISTRQQSQCCYGALICKNGNILVRQRNYRSVYDLSPSSLAPPVVMLRLDDVVRQRGALIRGLEKSSNSYCEAILPSEQEEPLSAQLREQLEARVLATNLDGKVEHGRYYLNILQSTLITAEELAGRTDTFIRSKVQ